MVEVELVDPAEGADASGVPHAPARRRRSPWLLPVGGVVLVVVGVLAGVLLLRGGETGGLQLDRPLDGAWTLGSGALLGTADGLVAVGKGGSVAGYAEDDGELLWELELGAPAVADACAATVTTDPATLWCWRNEQAVRSTAGDTEQRHAALVGLALRDGSVVVEHPMAVPWAGLAGVGDDLVVAERVLGNLTVRRLDARSWDEEWTTPLTLAADPLTGQFDATVRVEGDVVVVHGPTAAVLAADDGHVLQSWEPADEAGAERTTVTVTPYGFAAQSTWLDGRLAGHGVWYDAAGREVVEFAGVLAEPVASDGSEPGVVLVTREDGSEVAAVDTATGADLWALPTQDGAVLARREGAVVVATGGEVTSVELLTGWQSWRTGVTGLRTDAGHSADDAVALVMAVQGRAWRFVALDLHTGEVVWSTRAAGTPDLGDLFYIGGAPRLEVVGDRLVVRSGQGSTWLG